MVRKQVRKLDTSGCRWIGFIISFLFIHSSTSALAQLDPLDSLDEAEIAEIFALLQLAGEAESEARWDVAADAYHSAWLLLPLDEYRFAEFNCLELAGELIPALDVFRELSDSLSADVAMAAQERVRLLEPRVAEFPATLSLAINPLDAFVILDGGPVELAPDGVVELELLSGDYEFIIGREGYESETRVIQLAPGQTQELQLVLTPLQVLSGASGDPTIPLIMGGLALAGLGAGIVFGLAAESSAQNAWDYDVENPASNTDEAELLLTETDDFALAANIGFATAGAFAVGALLIYLLDGVESSDDVAFAPEVSPTNAGLRIQFAF